MKAWRHILHSSTVSSHPFVFFTLCFHPSVEPLLFLYFLYICFVFPSVSLLFLSVSVAVRSLITASQDNPIVANVTDLEQSLACVFLCNKAQVKSSIWQFTRSNKDRKFNIFGLQLFECAY